MNQIIHLLCFCLLLPLGKIGFAQKVQSDKKGSVQINIDPSQYYQTIEGWGSSLCWWAAQVGTWDEAKVDSIVDLITSPDKLNMNIFRYNIGGGDDPSHVGGHMVKGKGKRAEMQGFKVSENATYNWTADKGQRTMMLKIKAKRPDVVFEAFSNSPPYWMTHSGCSGGSIDPMQDNQKPEYYEAFCIYLIDVCKHYKDQYGIEFKTLEPFNESTSGYWNYQGSQEGCHFTPETQMKIIRMLYPKLKASGLKTVLSVSDETNIASTTKVLKAYLSAGDIIEKVGQLNTHTYSGTNSERTEVFDLVKTIGKPFWQSETGPSGNKKSSFETNLFLTQKLFDDMRLMKPQAWLDWQLMEESNEVWCLIRCNFNTQKYKIIKNLYVRMQITRFFKQGYTFIETGNEEAIAALNPEKTELVVAVINKNDHEKAFDLNFKAFDKKVKKAVIYRTCSVEDCAKILSFGIRKQAITYSAPGLSLTTFIIPLGN